MGNSGSTSTSSTKIVNDVVMGNKETLNMVNEQINNLVVNSMQKQAKSCKGTVENNQNIEIIGIKTNGPIKNTVTQNSKAFLNFGCVNGTKIKDEVSSSMLLDLVAGMKSSTDQNVAAKLDAASKSDAKSELSIPLFTAPSSSDSQTSIQNSYKLMNEKERNIVNKVASSIQKNFSAETLDECIASVKNSQSVKIKNLESNDIIENLVSQDAAAEAAISCVNNSDIGNKITSGIVTDLQIQTDDTTKATATTDAKAASASTATSAGLSDIVTSVFGGLSGIISAFTASPMLSVISSVVCVVIIIIIGFIMFKGGGKQGLSRHARKMAREALETAGDGEDEEEMMLIGGFLGDLLTTISYRDL